MFEYIRNNRPEFQLIFILFVLEWVIACVAGGLSGESAKKAAKTRAKLPNRVISALFLDVSLSMKIVAEQGGTHSHRPLRFVTSHFRFALASERKTKKRCA